MAATTIFAGVDLGGTNIECAVAAADGSILKSEKVATLSHEGPERILGRIAELVTQVAQASGTLPAALGVGIPGLVDIQHGMTRFLPNLPTQWRNVPAAEILSRSLGCPVYLMNDVRVATLGELTFGHGRGARTMAFFAIGTGIGGGLAIEGRLRLGPLGAAGELGHQTIVPDGPRCGCGNRGCLEALASGPALTAEGVRLMLSGQASLLRDLVGGDASKVSPRSMAEAAESGDEPVREAIVRASRFVGIAVANVVTILHPDLVVLGGGVAGIGPLLFDTVRATVKDRVRMFPTDGVQIRPSLLGDRAGIMGAVALAARGTEFTEVAAGLRGP